MIDAFSTVGIASCWCIVCRHLLRADVAAVLPPLQRRLRRLLPEPVARGPEDRPSNESYTKAIDMGARPPDSRIETFRNGGFLSTATFNAGNIFNGNGSLINLAGDKPGNMVIADAIGQSIVITARGGFGSRGYRKLADGLHRLCPPDVH
jgi:hypothetical protein